MKYLIKAGHLYWRHEGKGYTQHVEEAGIFTAVEAHRAEGLRREPLDEAIPLIKVKKQLEMIMPLLENRLKMAKEKMQLLEDNANVSSS